ncbi:acyltransferase family protein [Algoriphagus terrigena]|uniref:acyltransferase family protein n=1 Tax=Algoriphagus terrigena TaxID=344884 RepID=UPI000418229C|nr:heparan-alpha-glucosaminide N-acetyltransferase domain-containing protein [Algoriphagus terrigena]
MSIDHQAKVLSNRYLALDVFRGITLAFMIIVNTPGSWNALYAPLAHASWHGFTPTDLIFPTFLFVVGNAMSFAMKKLNEMPAGQFYRKVIKRTVLIFLIGWLLNAFPFYDLGPSGEIIWKNLFEVRLLGVLQRIALCYFAAALILYWGGEKLGWIFCGAALLLYWPILYFFGDADDPYALATNAATKLDLILIGADRLYMGEGIAFDPEGLLSTLPSIVNVIAGYLVGKMIQRKGNTVKTVQTLLIGGVVLIAAAYAWDLVFPINKKLWTSSYVLVTVGWDLVILAGLIFMIEVRNKKSWTYFFEVFGKNTLALYVFAWIVVDIFALIPVGETTLRGLYYDTLFTSWLDPKAASFFFSLSYMLLIWLIGWWMDRKKIYIKL